MYVAGWEILRHAQSLDLVRCSDSSAGMIERLDLTEFRNHEALSFRPEGRFIILHGPNGAGKTNILEAVSLLVPGRGLRRAALADMARKGGAGGFAVSAWAADSQFGTAVSAQAPSRRQVQVNGAPAAINDLAEWFAILWLTPAMDRLFADGAGPRRRFVDRLVLALDPAHAAHSSRYENALRQRNRMLGEGQQDAAWFDAIEARLAEHGAAIAAARAAMLAQLSGEIAAMPASPFAKPLLALEGDDLTDATALIEALRKGRSRDRAAGRTLVGPHRADLSAIHAGHSQPAAHCSTGEQKALLLSLILAHAGLVARRRGSPPILLLDEVAAHLDPDRRAALFERLGDTGSQVWMTGTEASLFDSAGTDAMRVHVADGTLG
jgi:DNA replication and repair protein RecF